MAGSSTGQGREHHEARVDVRTYDRMIGMMKWGGLACFLLAALVIWLIAN